MARPRRRRPAPGVGAALLPGPCALLLVGCAQLFVSCAQQAPVGGTVVVPLSGEPGLPAAQAGTVQAYYQSVFAQMRAALRGRDRAGLEELAYLLQQHDRPDMPSFARTQLEQYRILAQAMEFELGLPGLCVIRDEQPGLHLHATHRFSFLMRPGPGTPRIGLGLGGDALPTFQAVLRVRDFDVLGEYREQEDTRPLQLERSIRLTPGEELQLGFDLPAAATHVVVREVQLRIELLPCVLQVGDQRLPIGRTGRARAGREDLARLEAASRLRRGVSGYTSCGERSLLLYPEGYEKIQAAPLEVLRIALRRGGERVWRHIFLAAHFLPVAQRETAMALLIDKVRTGAGTDTKVAMGALRLLSQEDIAVTDRGAWLRWWQRRIPKAESDK